MTADIPRGLIKKLDAEYSMEPARFIRFAMKELRKQTQGPPLADVLKGLKRKATARAKERELSMEDFVRFCVEGELQRQYTQLHRVALRLHADWYARLKEVSANEPSRWVRTVVYEELKKAGFEELAPLNDLRTFNNGVGQTRKPKSANGYILRVALPEEYRSAIQRLYGERNVSYVIKRWLGDRINTRKHEPLTPLRPVRAVDGVWPRAVEGKPRERSARQSRRVDFT